MENKQLEIINCIRKQLPKGVKLENVLQEVLGISESTACRRINGEAPFTLPEILILCKRFKISIDEIASDGSNSNITFQHHALDLSNQEKYIDYLQKRAQKWNMLQIVPEKEFLHTAHHFPFYHCYPYDELNFFRLFVGNNVMHRNALSYDAFCNSIKTDKLRLLYRDIHHASLQIPSKEIWSKHTITTLVELVTYYCKSGAFESPDAALQILRQAKKLLDTVHGFAEKGYKDENGKVPFSMYLSPVSIANSVTLVKKGNNFLCHINLYLNNGMDTDHRNTCREMQQYFDDTIIKSTLISGGPSGNKLSCFFQKAQKKIDCLIKKIESGKLLPKS